jgi:hypothetical protein
MVTEEKPLSPHESLQLIANTIAMTKENIRQNSFPFLLWGWLIAIASVSFFFIHQYTTTHFYFLPFPVLSIAGVITTIIYYRKNVFNTTVSYLSSFIYKMWMVLGISFFVVVFVNVYQFNPPFTYTLIIAATGTLTSGLVIKFKPLIIGGIILFVTAIASVFIANDYKVLIHGFAIILGYLIPGYLLKSAKA